MQQTIKNTLLSNQRPVIVRNGSEFIQISTVNKTLTVILEYQEPQMKTHSENAVRSF